MAEATERKKWDKPPPRRSPRSKMKCSSSEEGSPPHAKKKPKTVTIAPPNIINKSDKLIVVKLFQRASMDGKKVQCACFSIHAGKTVAFPPYSHDTAIFSIANYVSDERAGFCLIKSEDFPSYPPSVDYEISQEDGRPSGIVVSDIRSAID